MVEEKTKKEAKKTRKTNLKIAKEKLRKVKAQIAPRRMLVGNPQ